jgi:5-methylcytosine-specific restriction endonuclease McrA
MALSRTKRRYIRERDGMRCRYCSCMTHLPQGRSDPDRFTCTIDHWLPKALGGTDDESNLVIACRGCNTAKGNQHPLYFIMGLRIAAYSDMLDNAHNFTSPHHYDRAVARFHALGALVAA